MTNFPFFCIITRDFRGECMHDGKQEIKKKCITTISMALILISVGLQTVHAFDKDDTINVEYEYINIKDMAHPKVTTKTESKNTLSNVVQRWNEFGNMAEIELPNVEKIVESQFPAVTTEKEPRQIWYLPTEMGRVTQNPHYGHAALDITSPRGSAENIFPVANGTISGIYTDPAGALVITVLHNINGQYYTSQYAHLSSYASGLYVGKEVTINDCLGKMGTTGYSTGVHLHLAVVDCALFNPNDTNCSNLNKFFQYANARLNQGYIGLGTMMYVPGEWTNR